jgi:hypothetical protein
MAKGGKKGGSGGQGKGKAGKSKKGDSKKDAGKGKKVGQQTGLEAGVQ